MLTSSLRERGHAGPRRPAPSRGDTPDPRLLKFQKEGVSGGVLPGGCGAGPARAATIAATKNAPSDDDNNRSLTLHR